MLPYNGWNYVTTFILKHIHDHYGQNVEWSLNRASLKQSLHISTFKLMWSNMYSLENTHIINPCESIRHWNIIEWPFMQNLRYNVGFESPL